ncbi:hypothetical protein BDV98DRAFT_516418, partial [Pterulicium gracile]
KLARHKKIDFNGYYFADADVRINNKERVGMVMKEVWDVTGYRFTVHDHRSMKTGNKTRAHCCQDQEKTKALKPSPGPNVKHRGYAAMERFACKGTLTVCSRWPSAYAERQRVSIRMKHEKKHQAYYSVALPPEALWIIEENVERSTPTELVGRIQALYRNLTSAQVHRAWTEKSQVLWERRADQLPSARALLAECGDEVDVLDTVMEEGVEQLCWAYKKLAKDLKKDEFTKEIAMDATYRTNSKHLKLYAIIAEVDGAGVPIGYCLLSTASALNPGKRKRALLRWATALQEHYDLDSAFVHPNQDVAEIGMVRDWWPLAKIQICWWH